MPFLRRRPPPSPSLTATLTGHGRAVNAAGFSPDGRLLASGCADWTMILWDVTDPARAAQRAALTHPGPGGGGRPPPPGAGGRGAGGGAGGGRAAPAGDLGSGRRGSARTGGCWRPETRTRP